MKTSLEVRVGGKKFSGVAQATSAVKKRLVTAADRAGPRIGEEMKTFLTDVAEILARRHGRAWPGGTSAKTLSKRSGRGMEAIRESIQIAASGGIETVEGRIGAPGYIGVHEKGATIRAKRAKYLAIPLKEALDARGLPKRRSPRDWQNTFVGTSKQGNLLIFQRRGDGIVPLYVLKKEVKIPARLGMEETIENELPKFIGKAVDALLAEMEMI